MSVVFASGSYSTKRINIHKKVIVTYNYLHALEDYEGKFRPERTASGAAAAVMAAVVPGHITVVIATAVAMVTTIGSTCPIP